jgi:type IX secretion system PorP/SprF family membrane protein
MSLKKILLYASMLYSFVLTAQQEPQYTQYMYNTMSVNPAYAGQRETLSVSLLHRSQWVGVEGAPQTQTLAVHAPIEQYQLGVGLSVVNDNLGPGSQTYVDGNLAYDLTLADDTKLAFGLKLGGQFISADLSQAESESGGDPLDQNISRFSPVFGAGAYLHNRKWYAGFSIPSLIPIQYFDLETSTARNRINYYLIGGYVFEFSDELEFKTASLIRAVSGAPLIADVSGSAYYNSLVFGLSWRLGDSMNILAGIQANENFYIGYAYDTTVSGLASASNGSHEILLRFEGARQRTRSNWKRCF